MPGDQVAALMRTVAADAILPRFRRLAAADIAEKSLGEVVTVVDREAEARLREGLWAIDPGARIVGEEACEDEPGLLDHVGIGRVWLVDPLDGTANFAGGQSPFGMMVALVEDGEPVSGWMLEPLSGRLCTARKGQGACIDGREVRVRPNSAGDRVAALATQFMAADDRDELHALARRHFATEPIPRCAAESYPRLVLGRNDVALFQRILPWDHAAGVLFLNEAGGIATHWDGSEYMVGSGRKGVLAASGPAVWWDAWNIWAPVLRALAGPDGVPA